MAETDRITEHPVILVIMLLGVAAMIATIFFALIAGVDTAMTESEIMSSSVDCVYYNVTDVETSEDDPDCGYATSAYRDLVTWLVEWNCTADPWAYFERTGDNCTCGCEDAAYRIKASWWDEVGGEDWEDPCVFNASWQFFGPPEENYTCDCGCDEDEAWISQVGVYDINMTDQNPENWTYEYNFTVCYSYADGMFNYWYDEQNNTYNLQTACNISQFYNVSEPCIYTNVTTYWWDTETHCNGSEDCGCEEGDDWWEWYSSLFHVTQCTIWNETNCSCDGELVNTTACVDDEYTWYEFEWYNESCEGAGNLTITTACNNPDSEWELIEEVFCYNLTNWDPEWPPWNYTDDVWFYSNCSDSAVVAYDTFDVDGDTYTFTSILENTVWITSYENILSGVQLGFGLYSLVVLLGIFGFVVPMLFLLFKQQGD